MSHFSKISKYTIVTVFSCNSTLLTPWTKKKLKFPLLLIDSKVIETFTLLLEKTNRV